MKYAYEDLSPDQFENLVVVLCQELLGMGAQKFSLGGDKGRDAKFEGTANEHPSRSAPWTGVTVVQAKHTIGVNRHFAEKDFFNPQNEANTVIGKELPKVVALRAKKQVDNYFLFANRRLGANAEEDIKAHISDRTGIPRACEPERPARSASGLRLWSGRSASFARPTRSFARRRRILPRPLSANAKHSPVGQGELDRPFKR